MKLYENWVEIAGAFQEVAGNSWVLGNGKKFFNFLAKNLRLTKDFDGNRKNPKFSNFPASPKVLFLIYEILMEGLKGRAKFKYMEIAQPCVSSIPHCLPPPPRYSIPIYLEASKFNDKFKLSSTKGQFKEKSVKQFPFLAWGTQ